mgnify:CR=1 FL=1
MESEQVAFYERVRSAYLDLERSESARITGIDASGDLASVQQQLDRAACRGGC